MKIGVVSDIHSDLQSLEKAFGKMEDMGCEKIVCLGDIVGYSYHYSDTLEGRDGDGCISMLRKNCELVICGNHDLHAVRKIPSNHRKISMPAEWYGMDLSKRHSVGGNKFWLYDDELEEEISEEGREYLAGLPESGVLQADEFDIFCSHFVLPDICGSTQKHVGERKDFMPQIKKLRKNKQLLGLLGHVHPVGYVQVARWTFKVQYYGKGELINESQVIIAPAITRGNGQNGFLVIDTARMVFDAISL